MSIQFDFYHVQIVGGDLIRRFEKHLPLIGHVQIAAVPSRHEPDEGEVNYPEIFAALDRLGYARLGRLRIPAARAHRGRPRLGAAATASVPQQALSRPSAAAVDSLRLPCAGRGLLGCRHVGT